jgi:hypothetical protein
MMATVRYVASGAGHTKFQSTLILFQGVYMPSACSVLHALVWGLAVHLVLAVETVLLSEKYFLVH